MLPLEDSKANEADQYSCLPSFRCRILPVLGSIPALFGNAMASYVLTEIAGFPTEPLSVKCGRKAALRLYKDLLKNERILAGNDE